MDDIGHLLRLIQPFLNHENQYYRDNKLVISTFAGQDSKFGHDKFEHGWAYIKGKLEEITPVGGSRFHRHAVVNLSLWHPLDLFNPIFLHRPWRISIAPIHGWLFQRTFFIF